MLLSCGGTGEVSVITKIFKQSTVLKKYAVWYLAKSKL